MNQTKNEGDAVRRLANGATAGMVDKELEKQGVNAEPRVEIMERAKRIINRRARLKHIAIGVVGLLILAVGGY